MDSDKEETPLTPRGQLIPTNGLVCPGAPLRLSRNGEGGPHERHPQPMASRMVLFPTNAPVLALHHGHPCVFFCVVST